MVILIDASSFELSTLTTRASLIRVQLCRRSNVSIGTTAGYQKINTAARPGGARVEVSHEQSPRLLFIPPLLLHSIQIPLRLLSFSQPLSHSQHIHQRLPNPLRHVP